MSQSLCSRRTSQILFLSEDGCVYVTSEIHRLPSTYSKVADIVKL